MFRTKKNFDLCLVTIKSFSICSLEENLKVGFKLWIRSIKGNDKIYNCSNNLFNRTVLLEQLNTINIKNL